MLKSMTGYGRSKYVVDGREYEVSIKSVNNRYCDINVRLPREICYLEEFIKNEVSNLVSRGKIDIMINFNNSSLLGKKISINKELAAVYIEELKELSETYDVRNDISVNNLTKMPDVLEITNNEDEEKIREEIEKPLKEALDSFINMKQIEGKKLAEDMIVRLEKIQKNINKISQYSTGLIEEYVVKLEERIKQLLKNEIIDKARLEQEVVIYADKCSVEEEVTRLNSHISQFKDLINQKDYITIGKKMDFIIQEMNRETNTIGSKANNLKITELVIEIKTEIEDIREQVQNIE